MRQWRVMVRKEWLELVRTWKLLWLPLAFVLFGAMQPVTTYFLPDILAHAGNLPEGALISIPVPSADEVLAQTLGQFNTVGLLLIALAAMNGISAERFGGLAPMLLVKPVSYRGYVAAKWTALLALIGIAFAGGFGAAYYYTSVLFERPAWRDSLAAFLYYGLWLALAGTLTLLFSALLRSGAAAAACSLTLLAGLALSASLLPETFAASPGLLPKLASARLLGGGPAGGWPAVAAALAVIAAALEAAALVLRRHPAPDAA
ncbi:ABC-2 type transport system permease protein [Paenibacillus sp. UNC496MF]|uniref:ABC transporter permease n=1 Tax=Paenibacillus sp. UNC496MF TaxID=1502753 RepID=UPI0008ED249D|nr:ABC transporter permease subunit [Paenibacillus sp. UNC496MF]SFJ45661.1 ABC-2 type transport system permease protein [Paenibacillus sp. UNC496MF]